MRKGIIDKSSWALTFGNLVFLTFFPGAFYATPASTAPADVVQVKELEERLKQEKKRLKAVNSREKDLLARLSEVEQEVAQKRRIVNQLNGKISHDMREVAILRQRLSNREQSLRDLERRMVRRLVPLYKYARRGYMKILATAGDLDQFRQRMRYLQAMMEEDGKLLARLADDQREARSEIRRIREQIARTEAVKKEEETRLSSVRRDLQKRVLRLMAIHKEKEFYERAVKELRRAAKSVKRTLTDIEKRKDYKTELPSHFKDSKGRLPFPLEGKVIRGDKLLDYSKQQLHKGIFIVSPSSHSDVKAVFPGRVEFSGTLKGYGETIIINHGSRFFTISAHLSERRKEAGDSVETDEVIGIARNNRPSKGAGIYFEIRRPGMNLEPLEWLKVN
ncbi:MAG: peptidoglycan DD-metalloendopeptidase family protein [Deltaproteobacteria bacterium]|nr:peptidoglycan DD-metalloendopeptidase family protein [Deltaproteobacteria bacterium]